MKHIPKGCDQQGRYPEAAHCATELGQDDEASMKREDFVLALVMTCVAFAVAVLIAWLMPGGTA